MALDATYYILQNRTMTIERMLQLYVANINSVIIWLALLCLGLIAFYLLVALRGEKLEFEAAGGQFAQLEETLKKVLENAQLGGALNRSTTEVKIEEGGVIPGINPDMIAEIDQMRKAISDREKEIAKLKEQAGSGASGGGGAGNDADVAAMKKKLKEVEAKLAEYEIIEDDIANLSLYKDENAKLKDEVDRLKKGGAVAAAPAPVAETPVAVPVATPVAEPVAVAAAEAPETSSDSEVTDDLMAEFEAAVNEQKSQVKAKVVPAAPPANDPPPPEAQLDEPVMQDLMAEFEAAVKAQKAAAENPPAVEEVASLEAMKPEPVATPVQSVLEVAPPEPPAPKAPEPAPPKVKAEEAEAVPASLAGEVDTDQMLSELLDVEESSEGAAEIQDDGDRLIAEFENFVKGSD